MRSSVAKAAAAYHSPEADTDVEEVYFIRSPGEALHGTQFLRVLPSDEFTRMGCKKPGYVFEGLIDREVRQWVLSYSNISDFSQDREQWRSRWMKEGICRSWLLCLEEHGFSPDWVLMPTEPHPKPDKFAGTMRFM